MQIKHLSRAKKNSEKHYKTLKHKKLATCSFFMARDYLPKRHLEEQCNSALTRHTTPPFCRNFLFNRVCQWVSHNALFWKSRTHSVNDSIYMILTEYFWKFQGKIALWECCYHALWHWINRTVCQGFSFLNAARVCSRRISKSKRFIRNNIPDKH